jgi:Abortive infection alpha
MDDTERPERSSGVRARAVRAAQPAVEAAPGLARVWAGAWVRTAAWTTGSAAKAGRRLTRAALERESPLELIEEARNELARGIRNAIGAAERPPRGIPEHASEAEALRARGAELLSRAADVAGDEKVHPAYERILTQLSPDEARILRLLHADGPQAAVDIRSWRPLDIGSRTVEPGLSMIGRQAGCLFPDGTHAYLNNLFRLGMIWFAHEELEEKSPYQVLEAQPEVAEAIERAGRARVVRRSIRLTPFGEDFCATCLPADAMEFAELGASEAD